MAAELIRPILTVDVVLLTLHDDRIHVVLQAREKAPHAGQLAPGGRYELTLVQVSLPPP